MMRLRILTLIIAGVLVVSWWTAVFTQSTGSLSGVVVSADAAPQPVRQAVVTVAGGGLAQSRSVVTDEAGRFSFENLPAGRFTVSASKRAYLTNAFGASRPGRAGTPVTVSSGQRLGDIRVVLPRGAVITGTVRDRTGQPAEGIAVTALDVASIGAARPALRPESVTTDDRGVYRIFGLAPGEYLVFASIRFNITSEMSGASDAEIDAALRQLKQSPGRAEPVTRSKAVAFAPTFHPGVVRMPEAGRIAVGLGDERGAVDITVQAVPTAKIEGTVVHPSGPLPPGVSLSLDSDAPNADFSMLGLSAASVGADGRFTFRGVTPGAYTIVARTGGRGGPADAPVFFARANVDVNGDDIAGVTLTLRPMLRVSGRVTFDSSTRKPPTTSYRVVLRPDTGTVERMLAAIVAGTVAPDGSFTVSNVMSGRYVMDPPVGPGTGWLLRSATIGDRDVADTGLEVSDSDVSGLTITMTDRPAELSGTLQLASGAPAPDLSIVLIPADKALWRLNVRRMKVARPGTDGRFVLGELPAGEYLLATATDLDVDDLKDVGLLEKLASGAMRVTLTEGERKVQDLKIAR